MARFEFLCVPRIVFGRGKFAQAAELAAPLGRRAMIVYNGAAPADRLVEMLSAVGVAAITRRQKGEPVVQDVDGGVEQARDAGCDLLIGLGGGSAVDTAKAVAGLLANGGSAVDYMEVVGRGRKITRPAVPWIAIPTTAGTGAEATRNAVIGLPEKKFKASLRSEHLLPRVALVDPALGVDVPPEVTARSGMDALCQLIESYTSTGANPMTDALALQGIPLAGRSLERACRDGHDLDAREDMALAALLSGITLTNAGLGAVHGFAAPLGANFPAPHGAICAALLPHVVSANILSLRAPDGSLKHPTLARYATVGRLLSDGAEMDYEPAILAAVMQLESLVEALQIRPLSEFGMKESDVPAMVVLAKRASSMRYNPVVLPDDTLSEVLTAAITGGPAED
jgi:alcohol dehydrogenase class IV